MYRAFYGLTKYPFEISPDPAFFCETSRHNEVLASLYHGVQRRKGFVVVTGEVGTGKTLLARCLFALLNRDQIAFSYVFNPLLSPTEFLQYALGDLGLRSTNKNKAELLVDLNRFLISRYRQSSTAALIIDEAHLLSCEVLEEIRLLTNLETGNQKLLQILLIGQPELERKIDSQELRQLKQRVALRCRLDPLSPADARQYIFRRLSLAGAGEQAKAIFPEATLSLIYQYSSGTPRLINTICENALISGFATKSLAISPELIEEVARDLCLRPAKPAKVVELPQEPIALALQKVFATSTRFEVQREQERKS
jgi:general secretion pathway protein A